MLIKKKRRKKIFRSVIINQAVDCFLDIGANVGIYSWDFLNQNKDGYAFLFEADTTNIRLLNKTINKNKIQNVFLIPFAVSKEVSITKFNVDEMSGATGSLISHLENKSSLHAMYNVKKTKKVLTISLDKLLELGKYRKTFIKIDVEGAEKYVLACALEFIKQCEPILQIESFDKRSLEPLEALDYSLFLMDDNDNYLCLPQYFLNKEAGFIESLGLKKVAFAE